MPGKTKKGRKTHVSDEPNTPQTIEEEYVNVGPDDNPEWITVAEFIRSARKLHGNRYDYSLVRGRKWEDIPGHWSFTKN